MANPRRNHDAIQTIIKALALEEFYPEKLTTDTLYEITELSLEEAANITPKTISRFFINRLTRSNYEARNLQIGSETATLPKRAGYLKRRNDALVAHLTEFHPLDVLMSVYLCCDPLAKQDLAKFMWGCKIAVPFIVHCETTSSPIIHMWPLRSLTTQWKAMTIECPNIKYPMQKIGFIRAGDLQESKSAVLNGVIGGPEKSQPIFFHRDMHGSQKRRSVLTEGLVEIGWYFPKGDTTDRFDSCKLFANLRGDASKNPGQLKLLLQVMDLVLVFSHTRHLLPAVDTIRKVVKLGKKTLLILTDQIIEDRHKERIDTLVRQLDNIDENNFEIVLLEDSRMAAKLDTICAFIDEMKQDSYNSLEDALFDEHVRTYVDEITDAALKQGIFDGKLITGHVEQLSKNTDKSVLLPFQGELWKQWTITEIESHKLEVFRLQSTKDDIQTYMDSLEVRKDQLREKQFDLLKAVSSISLHFIRCLYALNDPQLKVCLRTVKLGLDEISRTMYRPFYEKYKVLLASKKDADDHTNMQLNAELEKLDKEKAAISIGLEHFTRELGQIYEACYYRGDSTVAINLTDENILSYKKLPYLATRILLSGYPIEIMDGDVGFVPETWIKEVLSCVQNHLKKKSKSRLHVISVLGIQSSGKSTLLNTMFGLQFAVSAGRCTKGVFMQMIKISDSLVSKFKCDYILAIDTEGLRAAHASTKFDNELSCFSIGLADVTIVNLMGENAKYLEENLPVVVHAFLRMDMAGLKPQCILVHQNVDKTNRDKLLEQTRLLEKVLDELTAKACEIEEIVPPKRFKDIIRFDVSDSTYYIPGLLEGHLPMGPVSLGYSQECNSLRNEILRRSIRKSRHLTMEQFSTHLNNLWNAIKTDQFVFNFKTTAETQTSLQLEVYYSEIHSSLIDTIAKLVEKAETQMNTIEYVREQDLSDIIDKTKQDISVVGETHKQSLNDYMEDPKRLYSKIMVQWREEKLQRFATDRENAERDCIYEIETLFKEIQSRQLRPDEKIESDKMSEVKDMIKAEICNKKLKVTESTIEERVCRKLLDKEPVHVDTSFIKRGAELSLLAIFASEENKIEKALGKVDKHAETVRDLDVFVVKSSHVKRKILDKLHLTNNRADVERIATAIMKMTKCEVDHICVSKKPFTTTAVRRILLELKKMLERNKPKLTKDFRIDICVHVHHYVVAAFSNYYVQQKEKMSIDQESVRAMIQSMIKEENESERHVAQQVADIAFEQAITKTITRMFNGFLSLKSLLNGSKQQCIDNLLRITVNCRDFDLLEQYLTDPESAIIQMLMKYINTEYVKRDAIREFSAQLKRFETELSTLKVSQQTGIYNLISKAFKNALFLLPDFYQRRFRNVAGDALKARTLILKNIRNIDQVKWEEKLSCKITEHSKEIKQCAADRFLKLKVGCVERCPFCTELCMYDTSNHVGKHETVRHRPVGYNNIVRMGTMEVAVDDCTTLARVGALLHCEGKIIPFNNFSKFYPTWKIRTHIQNEVSLLWKWYFANHFKNSDLKIIVPPSWTFIKEVRVVRSLVTSEEPFEPAPRQSLYDEPAVRTYIN